MDFLAVRFACVVKAILGLMVTSKNFILKGLAIIYKGHGISTQKGLFITCLNVLCDDTMPTRCSVKPVYSLNASISFKAPANRR